MEKDKILTLNSILEGQQCKCCPFDKLCDTLVDNYQLDICKTLENSIKGEDK